MADPITGAIVAVVAWVAPTVSASTALGVIGTAQAIGAAAAWAAPAVAAATLNKLLAPKVGRGGSPTAFKADPAAPVRGVMGRFGVGGSNVHMRSWGRTNVYMTFMTALSLGPIDSVQAFTANGNPVTFPGAQGLAANVEPYKDKMWQTYRLGLPTDTALSPPTGLAEGSPAMSEWTSAHKMTGFAGCAWTMRNNSKRASYESGVPRPLWTLHGMLLWDWRKDSTFPGGSGPQRRDDWRTWGYTENPYVHAVAFARGHHKTLTGGGLDLTKRLAGIGATDEMIEFAAFTDGANIADANGWKIAGEWTTSDDKWSTLSAMLQAGGGEPLNLGAKISCFVNAPKVSIYTYTASDLIARASLQAVKPRRDRFNAVVPRYREEAQRFEEVAAGTVTAATYLTEDRNEARTREISYSYVRLAKQAAELAAYDLVNAREGLSGSLPSKAHLLGLRAGDAFTIQLPELGLNGQKAVVRARPFDPPSAQVTLEWRSETDTKHPFALGQTANPPPTPTLTGPELTPPAPDNTGGVWTVEGGVVGSTAVQPAIFVRGAIVEGNASEIIIEYRATGSLTWLPAFDVDANQVEFPITGLAPETSYEVAVSYRTPNGQISERLMLGPVTTGALKADPGDPDQDVSPYWNRSFFGTAYDAEFAGSTVTRTPEGVKDTLMRVHRDGVNLAPYSEDGSNAAWLKNTGVTITPQAAPGYRGGMTAQRFAATTTSYADARRTGVGSAGDVYQGRVRIKPETSVRFRVGLFNYARTVAIAYVEVSKSGGVWAIHTSDTPTFGDFEWTQPDANGWMTFRVRGESPDAGASLIIYPDRNALGGSILVDEYQYWKGLDDAPYGKTLADPVDGRAQQLTVNLSAPGSAIDTLRMLVKPTPFTSADWDGKLRYATAKHPVSMAYEVSLPALTIGATRSRWWQWDIEAPAEPLNVTHFFGDATALGANWTYTSAGSPESVTGLVNTHVVDRAGFGNTFRFPGSTTFPQTRPAPAVSPGQVIEIVGEFEVLTNSTGQALTLAVGSRQLSSTHTLLASSPEVTKGASAPGVYTVRTRISSGLQQGDWSFSRSGAAYSLNESGNLVLAADGQPRRTDRGLYVGGGATNLLLRSQELNVSPWAPTSAAAVSGDQTTAPDGTVTAELATGDTSSGYLRQQIASGLTNGGTYSLSIFVKAGTAPGSRLALYNSALNTQLAYAEITWTAGVPTINAGNIPGATNSVEAIGNGWYRLTVTGVLTDTGAYALFYPNRGGTAGQGVYAWGAQLEPGSFASPYIATTTAAVTVTQDRSGATGSGPSVTVEFELPRLEGVTGLSRGIFQRRISANERLFAYVNATGGVFLTAISTTNGANTTLSLGTAVVGVNRIAVNCAPAGLVEASFNGGTVASTTGGPALNDIETRVGEFSSAGGGTNYALDGWVREVKLYDHAIDVQEASTGNYPPDPTFQWGFAEGVYIRDGEAITQDEALSPTAAWNASTAHLRGYARILETPAGGTDVRLLTLTMRDVDGADDWQVSTISKIEIYPQKAGSPDLTFDAITFGTKDGQIGERTQLNAENNAAELLRGALGRAETYAATHIEGQTVKDVIGDINTDLGLVTERVVNGTGGSDLLRAVLVAGPIGGAPAVVALKWDSAYGTDIALGADRIWFGSNTIFDDATDTLQTVVGGNRRVLAFGAPFGASGNLLEWWGPSGTALSAMTTANGLNGRMTTAPYVFDNVTSAAGLTVTGNRTSSNKSRSGAGSTQSDTVTLTVTGGSGTYTYQWAYFSGDTGAVSSAPTSASMALTQTVSTGQAKSTQWLCVVTDTVNNKTATFAFRYTLTETT